MSVEHPPEALLKQHRKRALFTVDTHHRIAGREDLTRILPHRPPMLFLDALVHVDPESREIAGMRTIRADDRAFDGHFPGHPVYPGTFTVETIGQLTLCLYYFVTNERREIAFDASPAGVRATRILGAVFTREILPGSELLLLARGISDDGFVARGIGQAIVDGEVACTTIGEVCYVE